MSKNRVIAFTDAILAIVMTILVLELEKPAAATWQAIWDLRENFFAYAISFFWLSVMWINLHNEWHYVKCVSLSVIWWNVLLLFTSSLFPYVTSFVSLNFQSSVAAALYLLVALSVTIAFYGLANAVHKTNPSLPREILVTYDRTSAVDILIKVVGLLLAAFIYPPFGLFSVILSAIWVVLKMQLHIVDDNH